MILIAMITILISRFKSGILSVGLVAVLALTACSDTPSSNDQLSIVATTSIWGDVATQIVGDDADVQVLIPRHIDAHDYQPTPQQASRLLEADLVIANGLGLEEGLQDVLDSAERDGANILALAPHLDPLPFPGGDHAGPDPHVWFDPNRVGLAAQLIALELRTIDESVDWLASADAYGESLSATDEQMRSLLASVPEDRRKLVTNHEALGYRAEVYDLDVVGVVIPGGSTLADPSSAELAALVEVMEEEGVDVIFTETSQPSRLAEAVAAEVGRDISIVALFTESLGDAGAPAGTLVGLLLEDARLISEALG
jgi:zinc/manganese transport system substrate-binding protein